MKILLKIIFSFTIISFAPLFLLAQTDSLSTTGGLGGLVSKIPTWVIVAVPALYEFLVRVVPTSKNWSILSFAMNVFNWIIPNKSTTAYKVTNEKTGENYVSKTHNPLTP